MRTHHLTRRAAALGGALALAASAMIGLQLATAAPAAAVTGLQKVTGPVSATDSQLSKRVHADCPTGTRVIGGGGWVEDDTSADAAKVALVELQPVHPASGVDSYFVTGQEVGTNVHSNWWVQAYAICATPVTGMHIVANVGNPAATASDALCPAGEDPLGGGGKVNGPVNHVSLAGVSLLSTGDRISAEAVPDSAAFTGTWTETAYAVCAPTPPGYQVVGKKTVGGVSGTPGFVSCPAGTRVHSPAMSMWGGASTGQALQVIYPSNALDQVEVVAVDTQASSLPWNQVVAEAVCAT